MLKTKFPEEEFAKLLDGTIGIKNAINSRAMLGLSSKHIVELAKYSFDTKYIEDIIRNNKNYGLGADEIYDLLVYLEMPIEFINELINQREMYGFTSDIITKLILAQNSVLHDNSLFLEVIKNYQQYNLTGKDIADIAIVINDTEIIKQIITKWKEFGLDSNSFARLVKATRDKEYIKEIVKKHLEYSLKTEDIMILLDCFRGEELIEILKTINSSYVTSEYRKKLISSVIKQNLEDFLELEQVSQEKRERIRILCESNKKILREDFSILDEKYARILGEDRLELIMNYEDIVEKILSLNESQLNLLGKCLRMCNQSEEHGDWKLVAERILANIDDYAELCKDIVDAKDMDMREIISILVRQNEFQIRTIQDVQNYSEIKEKRCQELIQEDNFESKRKAVLLKVFGINFNEALEVVRKFGIDIDCIEDEGLIEYIKAIRQILDIDDARELEKVFSKVEELDFDNLWIIEGKLRNEFCRLFNKDLYKVEESSLIADNLYDAGTDFRMIITSIAPYSYEAPSNYYEDWNRTQSECQHFCTCYIRNDMMGCVPIPNVCFGFEKMENNSLLMSSFTDLNSTMNNTFVSFAFSGERFLTPDNLVNNTPRYNELDFARIQKGRKKQPDYIVVFKRNGEIQNLSEAKRASAEFSDIPIVVIDVDKCLLSEKEKVNQLLREYEKTQSPETARELYYKIRNNRITDMEFCKEIDLNQIRIKARFYETENFDASKKTIADRKVTADDLSAIYENVSATERIDEAKKIKQIRRQIRETLHETEEKEERE